MTTAKDSIDNSASHFDAVVIGAGASGLFFAAQAGLYGKQVCVLDHANKPGKKILMSGGGRCNFINRLVEPRHFISQNPHFVKSALSRYTPDDFIKLVEKHAIAYHEREHGQLFCDDSAKDILNMLLNECSDAGVLIRCDTSVLKIDYDADTQRYQLCTEHKKSAKTSTITAAHLVIATGGLSIPTMGASGFGYQVAAQFGHQLIPTEAALVPFTFTDSLGEMIKSLAGLSLDVSAYNDKISFTLPLLFTHRGLSGPAMLQLSNYWQLGETIHINLLPSVDVYALLIDHKKTHPKQLVRTVLAPHLPKKLLAALESHYWLAHKDTELANLKDSTLHDIASHINAWTLKPSGTEGYRVAEATRGGVDTRDISGKTMGSRLQPNLYFIGEVLDVTGWLGGYNFAWAWASGYACAEHIGMQW